MAKKKKTTAKATKKTTTKARMSSRKPAKQAKGRAGSRMTDPCEGGE